MRALLAALWLAAIPVQAAAEELRIGVLDYAGADYALSHWADTVQGLNAALPDHHFRLVALDMPALDAALAEGALDFVITNPGHYAQLEYGHRISRIATTEDDAPVAGSLITTQDLDSLDDLAGKRLAVVSIEAFGGFRLIWGEMMDSNPRLPSRIELVETGFPMQRVADAVLDGQADAGAMRACMLEQLQADHPGRYDALRVFAQRDSGGSDCAVSTRTYPGWPFAKTEATPPDTAKQVALALLAMGGDTRWTVPVDYQPVHDLLRRLRIGPYARGPVSPGDVVEDYRDWLIALALALLFWAIYSVRIERRVRQRTRELDDSNHRLRLEMAERQRMEETERQHRREIEHVARLSILGEMASSIAHELNQPLAAISGFAQGSLIRLQGGTMTAPEMQTAATRIAEQAERAATVIRRIRAFVRKREVQMQPLRPADLLRDSQALFAPAANRGGVSVTIDAPEGLPRVLADPIQMQQVLLNLVQNAIDAMQATPPEDRRIDITLRADTTPKPGVNLRLRDHGTGMDPAALARFAEAFHTTKPDGIGLGLALSRSIVEAHGGTMQAGPPAAGPGLVVTIWLPVAGDDLERKGADHDG